MTAPGQRRLRVVVVDDQAAVREGLVTLLDLLPDVAVVGAAGDGEQACILVEAHTPDVVLMDLRMPRVNGIEATRRIRADHPDVQVVVLTTYADDASILDALQAGALGYLTKDAGRDQIARALHTAAAGHALVEPRMTKRLLEEFARGPALGRRDEIPMRLAALTERELEVLKELRGMGITVMMSGHLLGDIVQLCSHVAIMREGRLIRTAAPTALAQAAHDASLLNFAATFGAQFIELAPF